MHGHFWTGLNDCTISHTYIGYSPTVRTFEFTALYKYSETSCFGKPLQTDTREPTNNCLIIEPLSDALDTSHVVGNRLSDDIAYIHNYRVSRLNLISSKLCRLARIKTRSNVHV